MRFLARVGALTLPVVLCTAVSAAEKARNGNLIRNPSFEVRSGPRKPYPKEPWGYGYLDTLARSPFAHWGYSGFFNGGDYDIKLGKGHTGKLSTRLVCRRRGRGAICTDEIRVKPGTKLRFHGSFRAIGAKGPCYVNFEGDPGDGWARIDLPKEVDYDWTEVTGVVTVGPPQRGRELDEQGNVRIFLFIYTKAFGELWIDDVTLVPLAAPPAEGPGRQ